MAAQETDLIVISRGGVNYKLTLLELAALLSGGNTNKNVAAAIARGQVTL